jgi:hypothetical protein
MLLGRQRGPLHLLPRLPQQRQRRLVRLQFHQLLRHHRLRLRLHRQLQLRLRRRVVLRQLQNQRLPREQPRGRAQRPTGAQHHILDPESAVMRDQ